MSVLEPLIRIVDDEETIRNSEAFIFKLIGIESVAYSSAEEFLEKVDLTRPGCIVADVRMNGMNGLEMMSHFHEKGIDLPIIFLTGHGTVDSAVFALKAGAVDFLQKPIKPQELQSLVLELIRKNIEARTQKNDYLKKLQLFNSLTDREKEVLKLVAKGDMNKSIAYDLGIAEHTVKIHRGSAMRKLGIRTAIEAHKFLSDLEK